MRKPLFRRIKRWVPISSAVMLSALLFVACGGNSPTILSPQGPVASQESGLFTFILVVATIVFVAVEGWLIFSIVRYRERPGMPHPRQIQGNNTVEIIWTVVPSIFLFAVLAGTIYTMFNLQNISSINGAGRLEVKAVGHQWWWEFDYPSLGNITTADTLYVPQGSVIQADLVSNNVIHSFWIPQITGKTDVIPGHNNKQIFRADTLGEFRGECAEYCGTQHAHMNFSVVVLSQDAFNVWASSAQQAAASPTDALAQKGQQIFKTTGACAGCHGIVGVNLSSYTDPKAPSLVGPNLTHFGSRHLIAGGVLEWGRPGDTSCDIVNGQVKDPANCGIYQWLSDTQKYKPGNDMVVSLTPDQITALVAYLESLK